MTFKGTTTLFLMSLLLTMAGPYSYGQARPSSARSYLPAATHTFQVGKTAPGVQDVASDTTLFYYGLDRPVLFDVNLGRDLARNISLTAVGMFFNAPFDGTVDRVDFALSNFPGSPGIAGTGMLRVKLIPGVEVVSPRSPGIDSLDVDFSDLAARQNPQPGNFVNQVDLTSRSFEVEAGQEYFIQFALADASDDAALTFVFDGGSNDSTDTRYFVNGDARSFVYVDSLEMGALGAYQKLRSSQDTTYVNLNVLLELHLTKAPPPPPPATARVQFIHNVPDAGQVDVYVGNTRVVDDLDFRGATSFIEVPAGDQDMSLVASDAPDNGQPIFSKSLFIPENRQHWAVALGGESMDIAFKNSQGESGREGKVVYTLVHGGVGAEAIDLNILDETADHTVVSTLADDVPFGHFADSFPLDPGVVNLEVSANDVQVEVFRLEVREVIDFGGGQTLLLTSGIVGGDPALAVLTINGDGTVSMPPVSTAAEAAAVPERFALHGNYPNPFNPETTIRFDLGNAAFTTLTVYNLLGQEVAVLIAEPLAAGSYAVAFDAAGLPSGPYLYRLTSGAFSRQKMLMVVK